MRIFDDRYDIGLFSGPFFDFKTHLSPPMMQPMDAPVDFWSMVQKFIEWSLANPELTDSLFDELAGVRSGATGSMETACLTLAIGIEALVSVLLRNETVASKPEFDPQQVRNLREHVEKWGGAEDVRKRALTALGVLTGKPSSVDRLYAFAQRTNLGNEIVDRWKVLRNKKAHGNSDGADQKLIDLYYSSLELLYRLIASTIGYTGKIAETSKAGWGMDRH